MRGIKHKINLGAFSVLIASTILLGTNVIALKLASAHMDPIAYVSLRMLLMGMVLLVFIQNYRILSPKNILRILPGAMLLVVFLALLAIGVSQSGALKASILSLTTPIFVYIYAILLLHEPIIKRVVYGGVLSLLGSLMMIGLPLLIGQPLQVTDLYLLIAFAASAGAIVQGKYLFRWLKTNEMLSVRFCLTGIFLIPIAYFFLGVETFIPANNTAWMLLLYGILFSGIIANTLYYRSLQKMKAEHAAAAFYVDPMTGTLLAALFLGELLDVMNLIGVLVIIVGVFIAHPHHHHVFFRYLHPEKHRIKQWLHRLAHPIKG